MSDFDPDLDSDDVNHRWLWYKVGQTALANIANSIVDVHSAVKVLAIAGALELGGLAMLIIGRDEVLRSIAASPHSRTLLYGCVIAFLTGFFLAFAVYRLATRGRSGFMIWPVCAAFGFLNGCIVFVLTT
jgi:hypothetical protein